MNKHGDNAFSVTAHTRHFYPVGHGIKINHFFPSKGYSGKNVYASETEPKENGSEPVLEAEAPKVVNDEKFTFIDNENKVTVLEPVKLNEKSEENEVSKLNLKAEETSVKDVPAVVSMIMNKREKANEKIIVAAAEDNTNDQVPVDVPKLEGEKKTEKEKPSSDSEAASSYYHSRIYYVGF